ncbi:MAG: hypothetical protein AAGJ84_09835 [Pseudomonadota bacterium]
MSFAFVRLLALIVCGLSAALIMLKVSSEDASSTHLPSYASASEARLSIILEPIFGDDAFRLALAKGDLGQLSLLVDSNTYPDGTLPIEPAALSDLVAKAVSIAPDQLEMKIQHLPFQSSGAPNNFGSALELGICFAIGLASLILLWALTRLVGPANASSSTNAPHMGHKKQHDYADAPSPERAAALIKGWIREGEPS